MFWTPVSQVQVLKTGVPNVGFKPFTSQREAGDCVSWWGSLHQGWGLRRQCVSASPTHFDVGFFLCAWCVGVTRLVSGFLLEDCSIGSCRSGMSVGGGEFRILLCRHLEPEPPFTFIVKVYLRRKMISLSHFVGQTTEAERLYHPCIGSYRQ